MKLTVLGAAGAFSRGGEATSGYLLQGEKNILIDCGSGVAGRLNHVLAPEKLDAIILTHLHADHSSDMGVLSIQLLLEGKIDHSIPVYLPATPAETAQAIGKMDYFETRALTKESSLRIGDITLDFLSVRHPVEAYALSARAGDKRFVYTSDTACFEGLTDFAYGTDLLLCDCAVSEARRTEKTPHMSAKQCGMLAGETGAKMTLLTHVVPYTGVSGEELLTEARIAYDGEIFLATNGQTYEI